MFLFGSAKYGAINSLTECDVIVKNAVEEASQSVQQHVGVGLERERLVPSIVTVGIYQKHQEITTHSNYVSKVFVFKFETSVGVVKGEQGLGLFAQMDIAQSYNVRSLERRLRKIKECQHPHLDKRKTPVLALKDDVLTSGILPTSRALFASFQSFDDDIGTRNDV